MKIIPGTCSVPGCGKSITTDFLMCGRHWRLVPMRRRSAVWDAWRSYQAGSIGLAELRQAQTEATEAVMAKGGVS